MKKCRVCGKCKNEEEFCFRNDSKKYRNECKICKSKKDKEYYQKNKDRICKHCQKNRKKYPEYDKEYYKINKESIMRQRKIHYWQNRESILKKRRKQMRQKRKTDLKFRLRKRISSAIRKALKGNKNGEHWEDILGYTLKDLIKRLEKTLPEGMTWQDYLKGRLHIDHIIPVSAFNFDSCNDLDFRRCFALENLQFLKPKDNMKKHNKIIKPFQPNLRI